MRKQNYLSCQVRCAHFLAGIPGTHGWARHLVRDRTLLQIRHSLLSRGAISKPLRDNLKFGWMVQSYAKCISRDVESMSHVHLYSMWITFLWHSHQAVTYLGRPCLQLHQPAVSASLHESYNHFLFLTRYPQVDRPSSPSPGYFFTGIKGYS